MAPRRSRIDERAVSFKTTAQLQGLEDMEKTEVMTKQFTIKMQGRKRLLEIGETCIGERKIVGVIKSLHVENEEYLKFYLKAQDTVFFDSRH